MGRDPDHEAGSTQQRCTVTPQHSRIGQGLSQRRVRDESGYAETALLRSASFSAHGVQSRPGETKCVDACTDCA